MQQLCENMFIKLIITQMKTKCHEDPFDFSIQCYCQRNLIRKKKNTRRSTPLSISDNTPRPQNFEKILVLMWL